MIQTGRFLWRFTWPNWLVLLGFAVLILLGAVLTGVPSGVDNLFSSYFIAFPMLVPMLMMFLSLSLCGAYLQVALSFGARRRDYFWCLQGILVLDVLVGYGLTAVMSYLPEAMHWANNNDIFSLAAILDWAGWLFPLLIFAQAAAGCTVGLIMAYSKVGATILMILVTLLSVAIFVALVLSELMNLPDWLWPLSAAVTAGIAAGSEIILWRKIRRHIVL